MQAPAPVFWNNKSNPPPSAGTVAPAAPVSASDPSAAVDPTTTVQEEGAPSASLYIGDLPDDVTEPMLYELFSQPASVASIRICRDSQTQRSLGYGYVNYHTIPDAERAMDILNFSLIKGRPCRIMWANRDKAHRQNGDNNVFVKNLDKNIDNKSLYDTFSLFGTIISCKVATDSNGKSLGYGYVQYEKEQSLVDAIKRVNGMQIGTSTVYCGRHVRKEDRVSLRDEKFTNLYVKGFDGKIVTHEKILEFFAAIGEITSHVLKVDDKGREALFVNMKEVDDAKKTVAELSNRRFTEDGVLLSLEESSKLDAEDEAAKEAGTFNEEAPPAARLYVTRHQSRAERDEKLKTAYAPKPATQDTQATVLYTRHFPISYGDDELRALFEPFGFVTSAKVAVDESGHSRGFGFVTMPESQDAQKAITALHDKNLGDVSTGAANLYVAYLEPKDIRHTRLKTQLADNVWRPTNMSQYRGNAGTPSFPNVIQQRVMPAGGSNATFRGRGGGPATNNRGGNLGGRGGAVGAGHRNPTLPPGGITSYTDAQFYETVQKLGLKEQKQAIGDRLYHVIMSRHPSLAGKITGMMLEMPNEDLVNLLQRPDELSVKVDEAIEVLKAASGNTL